MMAYFFTCWLSGVVEIGIILWGISVGYPVEKCLFLALAYQLGNLLCFIIGKKLSRSLPVVFLTCAVISLVLMAFPGESWSLFVAMTLLVLFSTFLQNIRSATQGKIPRWKKRTCRVVGFLCSPIMYYWGLPVVLLASIILSILAFRTAPFFREKWLTKLINGEITGDKICLSMVTHQAHYFSYTYVMLFLTVMYYGSPIPAALWFVANWIPYTITEPLVQLTKWNKWMRIVIVAHIFNMIVLCGMFIFAGNYFVISLCLWILTGFGGGNVFCLKKALDAEHKIDKEIWSFSEQIGHILGCICCILVLVLPIDNMYTLIVGAVFALLTVPITLVSKKKM